MEKDLKDYYYILGIKPDSNLNDIKKAYRKLSMKFHPDKNDNDTFFTEHFKSIQEAYECLSNIELRSKYDNLYYYKTNESFKYEAKKSKSKPNQSQNQYPFDQKENNKTNLNWLELTWNDWWNNIDIGLQDYFKNRYKIVNKPDEIDFKKIAQTKTLKIDFTSYSTINSIVGISKLTNLKEIDIAFHPIEDIGELKHLKNLRKVHFSKGCNIGSIEPLSEQIKLRRLMIYTDKIENINHLSKLTKLRELNITATNNNYVPLSDITVIKRMKFLSNIVLHRTSITNIKSLKYLLFLKSLDISYTKVRSIYPLFFAFYLRELWCINTQISNFQKILLRLRFPFCKIIDDLNLIK